MAVRDEVIQKYRDLKYNEILEELKSDPEFLKAKKEKYGEDYTAEQIATEMADRLHLNTSIEDKAKEVGKEEALIPLLAKFRKAQAAMPDAPLKKNWNEFLMKKALHDAATGNYDKLAWTTGQTQAQRYNKMIQDNINELHYMKTPNDDYVVSFRKPGDVSLTSYNVPVRESDLADHFGGHIADQMKGGSGDAVDVIEHDPKGTAALREMGVDNGFHFKGTLGETFTGYGSSPEEAKADLIKSIPRLAGSRIIRGDNISVGSGRGMQGFYDKMQGDFLNKFLKKYGEKVHTDHVLGGADAEEVNAVNITPEMRKDLTEKGFPFFKKGGLVTLKKKK
jgi:hypothetical protein